MPRFLTLTLLGLVCGGPSLADDLTWRQQSAFDAILPGLALALGEGAGDAAAGAAPILARCIVTGAERSELRRLARGEVDEEDTRLLNALMMRPSIQGCVASEANK